MPSPVVRRKKSEWTPRFPGLSDAESCGEWDTGIPIVHKVRDRDEVNIGTITEVRQKALFPLRAGQGDGAIAGAL